MSLPRSTVKKGGWRGRKTHAEETLRLIVHWGKHNLNGSIDFHGFSSDHVLPPSNSIYRGLCKERRTRKVLDFPCSAIPVNNCVENHGTRNVRYLSFVRNLGCHSIDERPRLYLTINVDSTRLRVRCR